MQSNNAGPGTFLIRFSHSLGGYAATYLDSRLQVLVYFISFNILR